MQRILDTGLLSACLIAGLTFAGCSGGGEEPATTSEETARVIVYSGRNERLIQPLLERFTDQTGIAVNTRYGDTAELAATLLEEGDGSPAHLFISQDAAALGAVSRAGLLQPLPQEILSRVPARFRSGNDDWVGLSGRARVVVYNTGLTSPDKLPQQLQEITDPRFQGKFGVAPTNASFQAHMAVYAALNGEEALDSLLVGTVANAPIRYPKNSPIVQAVIAGEIEWGLVNHYYLWQALREQPDAPARNFFMPGGDASSFINVAGVGVLNETDAAVKLVEFMLSEGGQRYFADETFEYPLVPGVPPGVDLPALDELATPDLDYRRVAESLEPTLVRIEQSGLNRF